MAKATYVLEIDWNNDGDYAGANDDVTADLLDVECKRGRDYASQLTGRATAGRLVATLKNISGTYSSLNSASPIYGDIVPGRKVRLRTTAPDAYTIWTGYLKQISPSGSFDGFPVVTLEASGSIERLNGKQVTPAAQASQTTGVIVGAILDAAGWPAGERTIDTGQTTVTRWYVDKMDALNAIREVEETELGFFYEAEDGKLVFEDRHFRLIGDCLVSQATFSDAATAALSYRSIEQQDPLREIYNDIVATVSPFTAAGASELLWTLREQPTIPAGYTLSWWAEYPNSETDPDTGAYVATWDDPVGGTDVTVTGVDISDIAIAVSKFANAMKISLTNNGAATATVTLLQAQGTKVTKQAPVRISAEDATSQTAYGERTYQLPGPWLPTTAEARDFVDYLLSRYKNPLPVLVLTIQGHRSDALMEEVLSRKISDRVTVVAEGSKTQLGIDGDFFIEAISHRISSAGYVHDTTFELSSAAGDGAYFVIGSSLMGVDTHLVY